MTGGRFEYDAVVIGAGVIGCNVALYLTRHGRRVLVVERASGVLTRASFNNQARVHNGYHYPRSLLTGLRSRVNFPRFVDEYDDCIVSDFQKYYAIARRFSKVSADQFAAFCRRIGAAISPAPKPVKAMFDTGLVEDVFTVQEYAFDAAKLGRRLRDEMEAEGIEIRFGTEAERLQIGPEGELRVVLGSNGGAVTVSAGHVFNCTYSRVNSILATSDLPLIPLKHEMTELALVDVPDWLRSVGITVMCGPFFSIMPFPARGLHSFSHVRYTPHTWWEERNGDAVATPAVPIQSNFGRMQRDAQRFIPALREVEYRDSLYETKTVLPSSDIDDSRPILFKRHEDVPNLVSIMGGKIDNVYDVIAELDLWRSQGGL